MTRVREDRWGVAISAGDAEAVELFDAAVAMMRDFEGQPFPLTTAAVKRDPDFALIHALRALLKLLSKDFRIIPSVAGDLAKAEAALAKIGAPAREAAWIAAARAWFENRLCDASTILERHLANSPRDYMALHAAYHLNFAMGRAWNLRAMPARVAAAWRDDEIERGVLMGMEAFGLEETGEYARAEAIAREAVARNPRDTWGVHAVSHVLEMEARADEGVAWMNGPATDWAGDRHLVTHQWWHLALFEIARGRTDAALSIHDDHMRPRDDSLVFELHDGASMLWRFGLLGVDVGARADAMASAWMDRAPVERYAFSDLHAMLAFAQAGRLEEARAHLARTEARAADPELGDWRRMGLAAGVDVCRGVLAYAEERWEDAVDALTPARHAAQVFGGSHAQRGVIDATLARAAAQAGETELARQFAAERAERVGLR